MNKKTILVDLDDTLIHTCELNKIMRDYLVKSGVPKEILEGSIKEFREHNNNHVDVKKYIHFLKQNHPHVKINQNVIDDFYNLKLDNLLKGNVISTILQLKKVGFNIHLLSKGDEEFQMFKIKNANLYHLFNPNIHICKDKNEYIKKLNLTNEVIVINDRLKETKSIRAQFPHFRYFHVNRYDSHGLYDSSEIDLPTIDTVDDLLKILN